jgi:hypothetical protein
MPADRIEVFVASFEEAEAGIAELWVQGVMFGHTLLSEGELVLCIEPRRGGRDWELGFNEVRRSLDQALERLRPPRVALRSPGTSSARRR